MANNRMFLRCGHCDGKIMLAKYYPDPNDWLFAWGTYPPYSERVDEPGMSIEESMERTRQLECKKWIEKIQAWLEEHNHGDGDRDPFLGPTHYRVEYESLQDG